MQDKTRLPTALEINHVRQLLNSQIFDEDAISRMTGVPLADVFRIAGSLPPPTDMTFPNPRKQLAEFMKRLFESV